MGLADSVSALQDAWTKAPRRTQITTSLALTTVLAFGIYYSGFSPLPAQTTNSLAAVAAGTSPHWNGWSNIEHLVTFGDSISNTHFRVNGRQPTAENPLGNPPFPGQTTAEGPNWIGYLTSTYNQSLIKTINLSFGGATVDANVIPSVPTTGVKSFTDQITTQWLELYAPASAKFPWKPSNTIFMPFVGNNDLRYAYESPALIPRLERDIASYISNLKSIYRSGGRNFMILNVAPMERTPGFIDKAGPSDLSRMGGLIQAFNNDLAEAVKTFGVNHPDATVFVFDTYATWARLLNNPCSDPDTCSLKYMKSYCEDCDHPAEDHFWLGTVHPSWRVHKATAKAIVAQLDRDG